MIQLAERRMFAKTIIDSDAFLDMPMSSQALYFHLSMRADDDGFINNPKRIQRMIGASDDDLKLLIAKSFIITFESGVVVIKHWKIHNYIQSDRYKPTSYIDEKKMLVVKTNKAYTLNNEYIDNVSTLDTQYRLDKVSIGKVSIGKNNNKQLSDFDLEEAWKKIRDTYPKNRRNGLTTAKFKFLDRFKGMEVDNYKYIATIIARAIDLYKKDCVANGDESFKYVPNMDKWFDETADFWIEKAEEYERRRNEQSE